VVALLEMFHDLHGVFMFILFPRRNRFFLGTRLSSKCPQDSIYKCGMLITSLQMTFLVRIDVN